MRFWWNKQPQTKKRVRMEVEGVGLQEWGLKVAGRDKGPEHISKIMGKRQVTSPCCHPCAVWTVCGRHQWVSQAVMHP